MQLCHRSLVLISTILTKLCCFNHDNTTVLTLSKILKLLTVLRVSLSLELKEKIFKIQSKVYSVLRRSLSTFSTLFKNLAQPIYS